MTASETSGKPLEEGAGGQTRVGRKEHGRKGRWEVGRGLYGETGARWHLEEAEQRWSHSAGEREAGREGGRLGSSSAKARGQHRCGKPLTARSSIHPL